MKHLWFGAGLLAGLLAVSLWLGSALEATHQPSAKDLEKATEAAQDGDWELASALYIRAEKHWDKHRNLSAALLSHGPIEQVDTDFAALKIYAARQEATDFCVVCTRLARNLRGLTQPHRFSWWNLL